MIEQFPKIKQIEKPNERVGLIIRGRNSQVSDSAINVYESGANNSVGPGCENVSIFNSSGCAVLAGVKGATIINSSGVIASNDNEMWVNNARSDKATHTSSASVLTILASVPVYEGGITIKAFVFGLKDNDTAGYAGEIYAAFRVEAGSLILIGQSYSTFSDGALAVTDVTAQVSGNNAQIVIMPEPVAITWTISYTVQKI